MKLVPNWKDAPKWLSMNFITAALIWEGIPQEARDAVLSPNVQGWVTFVLLILAGVGRMIDQGTAK
jgi:hypothetical protein